MTKTYQEKIALIKEKLQNADAVLIGAGAGLSAAAGFTYSGERFDKTFSDFAARLGFHDMYTGGFEMMRCSPEEYWAYWSRMIYVNRFENPPKDTYTNLHTLVRDKDFFVLTTNVDHCFQQAGFDKNRLFYTQGDYGLWQCSKPCRQATYDNRETVEKMLAAQGFVFDGSGKIELPEGITPKMRVPTELVPKCPVCGRPMTMNLRADETFVQDDGWYAAAERYNNFVKTRRDRNIVLLELGVGFNTPSIIKYPFIGIALQNPAATYACVNYGYAVAPKEIADRAVCIDGDADQVIRDLL